MKPRKPRNPSPPPHFDAVADGVATPEGRLDDPADVDALRFAIEIKAAAVAADLPSEEFVAGLRHRLSPGDESRSSGVSRRALLTGAGAIAAGALGVVADRAVLEGRRSRQAAPAGTVVPDQGTWVPVASRSELADGQAHRFATATAIGFISQVSPVTDSFVAVSGACTHQGCLLQANADARRLDCPCHRTSFGLDGDVLFSQLADQPPSLPKISARLNGGDVEVFLPRRQESDTA